MDLRCRSELSALLVQDRSLCHIGFRFPSRLVFSALRRINPVDFVLEFALPDDASNLIVFFGVDQAVRMFDSLAQLALT